MRRMLALVACLVLLVAPGHALAQATPAPDLAATTPEEQGFDSMKLADILEKVRASGIHIHSLLVARNGGIFLDASFYPYDSSTPHEIASVTKSVTTTLLGIAIDQGKLKIDDPVLSFFPDRTIANRDTRKERMTVGDLASMTSGLDCVADPDEPTLAEMNASPDWVQFTLDLPMVANPGTTFSYCSPATHLLSAIIQQATGMTEVDFARRFLFGPLGITNVVWPADAQGHNHGWGDLYLFPRDMAKIGQLFLDNGMWQGRQIVSQAWVKAATAIHAKTTENDADYGYGWWVFRPGTAGAGMGQYEARGRSGQRIVVLPGLKALVVTTGSGFEPADATDQLATALIDPAKPIAANPAGVARLNEATAAVAQPPAPQPVPPLPAMARTISGKAFMFSANPVNLASFQYVFDQSDTATLTLTFSRDQPDRVLAIGLDGVFRMSPGEDGFPSAQRGHWEGADTFVVEYETIANRETWEIRARFTGDRVALDLQELSHQAPVHLEGTAKGA